MDKDKVADQDFFSVISYLSGNDVALPIVWDFIRVNYMTIKTRYFIYLPLPIIDAKPYRFYLLPQ